MEERLRSRLVTSWSSGGKTDTVNVRNRMVNGSRKSRVRLPNSAATSVVKNRPYLTDLQDWAGALDSSNFLRRGVKISSVVPNGQIQPHQARPTTRVKMMITIAREEPARKVLLESV